MKKNDVDTMLLPECKIILTYGTFDTLHFGHINLLREAARLGTTLIVAVSTDEFNAIKGKKSFHSYNDRCRNVSSLRWVERTIPEENWDQKINDVQKYKPHAIVMGSDWEGQFDFLKPYCDVIYLPRTPNISSTFLRDILKP